MKPFSTDGKYAVLTVSIVKLAIHLHININGNVQVFTVAAMAKMSTILIEMPMGNS